MYQSNCASSMEHLRGTFIGKQIQQASRSTLYICYRCK